MASRKEGTGSSATSSSSTTGAAGKGKGKGGSGDSAVKQVQIDGLLSLFYFLSLKYCLKYFFLLCGFF
ncbi:hypothetical protein FD755_016911 [Muntiacus reevesi]|uniref:Uncharacterized protein n=1 Tax=Muntiacus reevesi TaxID=9886 RepID=A0A5N3XHQ4_MUNRE|nr:hypothetical protein FD755_016911 [Muntiacus reevesi]